MPEELANAVIDWLYDGKSLWSWCEENGFAPSSVYRWTYKDDDFAQRFSHARRSGAASKVDYAEHVARTQMMGEVITEEVEGDKVVRRRVVREDMVAHRKLLTETLLKVAACFDPANFGTKAHLEHSGGVSVQVVTGVPGE